MDPITIPKKPPRVRRNREQWRELLERFQRSAQNREQFCREQGLSLGSFDRWRRELGKVQPRRAIAGEPLFLELTPDQSTPAGAWDLELQLGAGVLLRLRRLC